MAAPFMTRRITCRAAEDQCNFRLGRNRTDPAGNDQRFPGGEKGRRRLHEGGGFFRDFFAQIVGMQPIIETDADNPFRIVQRDGKRDIGNRFAEPVKPIAVEGLLLDSVGQPVANEVFQGEGADSGDLPGYPIEAESPVAEGQHGGT